MITNSRPNYLKAILFTNNLEEVGGGAMQSQCFTVQDYHYHIYRERDEQVNPYGVILSEYLEFSLILADKTPCKFFYQAMDTNENMPVSIIFNATFSPTGRLADYEDGLITYGYVISVEETCDNNDDTGEEQILLRVKMLLCNMHFLGSNTVHHLEITKD